MQPASLRLDQNGRPAFSVTLTLKTLVPVTRGKPYDVYRYEKAADEAGTWPNIPENGDCVLFRKGSPLGPYAKVVCWCVLNGKRGEKWVFSPVCTTRVILKDSLTVSDVEYVVSVEGHKQHCVPVLLTEVRRTLKLAGLKIESVDVKWIPELLSSRCEIRNTVSECLENSTWQKFERLRVALVRRPGLCELVEKCTPSECREMADRVSASGWTWQFGVARPNVLMRLLLGKSASGKDWETYVLDVFDWKGKCMFEGKPTTEDVEWCERAIRSRDVLETKGENYAFGSLEDDVDDLIRCGALLETKFETSSFELPKLCSWEGYVLSHSVCECLAAMKRKRESDPSWHSEKSVLETSVTARKIEGSVRRAGRVDQLLNARQTEAIEAAISCPFVCLVGTPGTGKTAVLETLLNVFTTGDMEYRSEFVEVLTLGAAMAEELRSRGLSRAKTIHRFLKERGENGPSRVRHLIVDEFSNVSLDLLASLLRIDKMPELLSVFVAFDPMQTGPVTGCSVASDFMFNGRIRTSKENEPEAFIRTVVLKEKVRYSETGPVAALDTCVLRGRVDWELDGVYASNKPVLSWTSLKTTNSDPLGASYAVRSFFLVNRDLFAFMMKCAFEPDGRSRCVLCFANEHCAVINRLCCMMHSEKIAGGGSDKFEALLKSCDTKSFSARSFGTKVECRVMSRVNRKSGKLNVSTRADFARIALNVRIEQTLRDKWLGKRDSYAFSDAVETAYEAILDSIPYVGEALKTMIQDQTEVIATKDLYNGTMLRYLGYVDVMDVPWNGETLANWLLLRVTDAFEESARIIKCELGKIKGKGSKARKVELCEAFAEAHRPLLEPKRLKTTWVNALIKASEPVFASPSAAASVRAAPKGRSRLVWSQVEDAHDKLVSKPPLGWRRLLVCQGEFFHVIPKEHAKCHDVQPAYAITVNLSQGKEFDEVAVFAPSDDVWKGSRTLKMPEDPFYSGFDRSHVHVAFTRAPKLCIFGSLTNLKNMATREPKQLAHDQRLLRKWLALFNKDNYADALEEIRKRGLTNVDFSY